MSNNAKQLNKVGYIYTMEYYTDIKRAVADIFTAMESFPQPDVLLEKKASQRIACEA